MKVFKADDFQSVKELTAKLRQMAEQHEETIFLLDDGMLWMVVPAEAAREKIAEKIATRLAESPSLLHDIQSRLESEKPEHWE